MAWRVSTAVAVVASKSSVSGTSLTGSTAPAETSFRFFSEKGAQPYEISKAIEVMKQVYARRSRQFTSSDEQLAMALRVARGEA